MNNNTPNFKLEEIYENFKIREQLDIVYRKFYKKIDKNKDFSLTDDEIFELYIDLIEKYKYEYDENFK